MMTENYEQSSEQKLDIKSEKIPTKQEVEEIINELNQIEADLKTR